MKLSISLALTALILTAVGFAQSTPAVDVFGGYSYLNLEVPSSGSTVSQSFKLNGWDASGSIGLFHHLSAEADFSGHQLGDCGGISGLNCSDFSYMFGPRFTFGDRSNKATAFVHALVGRDRATILAISGLGLNDTSIAAAGGAGLNYWFMRHVGVQLGPIDALYTNHLNNQGASGQLTYRAAAGVAFRFGGNFPETEKKPKAPKEQKEKPKYHRSWKRPWHKIPNEPTETEPSAQPSSQPSGQPAPPAPTTRRTAQPAPSASSRGMSIRPLGIVAAPQEFDGAKILEIEPGSVAEMASLHVGDLIKSVDGKAVRTPMELAAELSDKTGKVRITIQRGTFTTETVILLGAH
jgi:PDZ domain